MFSPEFILTSLIVILIPGVGVVYTVSTTLLHGRRPMVAAAVGCTLGIVPHLVASILGLSVILHKSALLFQGLKWVGTLYLFYLAWSMWRDTEGFRLENSAEAKHTQPQITTRHIIQKGIFLNLLNPKLTLFFFAFLPLFIAPNATAPLAQMSLMSGLFMVLTLLVFILYGLLAGSVRTYIVGSPHFVIWLRRSFAATFALLGLKLAATEI